MIESRRLFSLDFQQLSLADVVELLIHSPRSPFSYLVTPNVDHIVRLGDRPELRRLYRSAAFCLCDSRILSLLARGFGYGALTVVPGSDLTKALVEDPRVSQKRICIVGATATTVTRVSELYGLTDVFHYNPPMGFIRDSSAVSACVDFVVASEADWVFLAVGSPQQEILAYRLKEDRRTRGIGLCIGASLLFLSGEERRAPRLWQVLHVEWLFRLLGNPRRLARRYLIDGPRILGMFLSRGSHT